MFNRRIGDELAAVQEIVQVAVSGSRVPGQRQSGGNAAGALGAVSNAEPVGVFNSGVTPGGASFFPFLLDVDTLDGEAKLG